MKYVLDSNISLKWVLTEADSDKARRLRGEFQNQIHELLAPDVFPVEVAHGLVKTERRGVIPQGGRGHAVNERPFDAAAVPSLSALAQESARHCLPGSYRRIRLPHPLGECSAQYPAWAIVVAVQPTP